MLFDQHAGSGDIASEIVLHDDNSCTMELVHHLFGRYTHGTYKQLCTTLNDNVGKLRKLALRVVVLRGTFSSGGRMDDVLNY